MRIGVLYFTDTGRELCGRLCRPSSFQWIHREPGEKAASFVERLLPAADAFVFIGAVGIAVRTMAPFLKSKAQDPAVVVLDERGKFAISLLSGHLGGANELTQELARQAGAQPVITTATDLNGVFAVDVWAKRHGCRVGDISKIKEVSGALLRGEPVGLSCDFPVSGSLPEGVREEALPVGIQISLGGRTDAFPVTLPLIPRIVTLGVGCRKGTNPSAFEGFLLRLLERQGVSLRAVRAVASIDLKAEEPCILEFCRRYGLPFLAYTPEQLREVPGEFTSSDFVARTTGVDNVCERSAVCAGGTLFVKKYAEQGMTAALAMENWSCEF